MKIKTLLSKFKISNEQLIWLRAIKDHLFATGTNPDYKALRLKTLQEVGDDLDYKLIDHRLLERHNFQITLLGILKADSAQRS